MLFSTNVCSAHPVLPGNGAFQQHLTFKYLFVSKLFILPFLLLTLVACEKETKGVTVDNLLGTYQGVEMVYQLEDGTVVVKQELTEYRLDLRENFEFERDHITGTWSLDQDRLNLYTTQGIEEYVKKYYVVRNTDTELSIRTVSTTGNSVYTLYGLPPNTKLLVTTRYLRE